MVSNRSSSSINHHKHQPFNQSTSITIINHQSSSSINHRHHHPHHHRHPHHHHILIVIVMDSMMRCKWVDLLSCPSGMLPVVPGAKRLYRAPAGTLPARGCALVLLHLPARLDEPCDQVLRNGLALLLGNDLTNTGSETSLVHGRALLDQVAQV